MAEHTVIVQVWNEKSFDFDAFAVPAQTPDNITEQIVTVLQSEDSVRSREGDLELFTHPTLPQVVARLEGFARQRAG